ncbi:MAG: pectinesterase family protein [Pseudomonadota bacterium]|nr:pectinesterase family protein [Pseudomonadota bacterium]
MPKLNLLFLPFLPFLLVAPSGTAFAQDSRNVTEPVIAPACAILIASRTSADASGKDDSAQIQAAIDHCPAGQSVRLAASNEKRAFVSGPLQLRSGVSLEIAANTTLYASRDPTAYDRGGKTCGTIDAAGNGCRPFITATDTNGSGIVGAGVIDGQGGELIAGKNESWWQLSRRVVKGERQSVPRLIEVTKSRDFTLYQVTLRNSPNFHVAMSQVDGFTAWGIRIDTPATARNTDGIDPGASRNVTIAHSFIRTGDDNVAIKAGKAGATENVSILHNHFYSGHGMSIGSETIGGVRRVLVDDLTMDGTTSGLRIKSDVSRGGLVSDVTYRNVCIRGVKWPIYMDTVYAAGATGSAVPRYENVALERVHVTTPGRVLLQGNDAGHPIIASLADVVVDGNPEVKIEHARLGKDGRINLPGAKGIDCTQRFVPFPQVSTAAGRPQLTAAQAKGFAYAEVLKYVGAAGDETVDPWDPLADPLATGGAYRPDYTVDPATANGATVFATVQAAIDRAVRDAKGRRVAILVKPGLYRELLYVPEMASPITLYSDDPDASRTRITAVLHAAISGAGYSAQFGAQFGGSGAGVAAMFDSLKGAASVGTPGSAVVWIKNSGFQARNMTFENGFNKDTGDINPRHQALAVLVDGADKVQFENVRFLGFQDTLFVKSRTPGTTVRSFFHKAYIEGDVDFIFGDTTAYFYQSEIKSLGDRTGSYVAAPNTHLDTRYGFVFDSCHFSHDGSANALAGKFYLARQWFHGARCTPYASLALPGYRCTVGAQSQYAEPVGAIAKEQLESVGKMVVLNSRIDAHIQPMHPWSDWNRNGQIAYRPAQFTSDDYWANLRAAGIDPVRALAYSAPPSPPVIFLGEFNTTPNSARESR